MKSFVRGVLAGLLLVLVVAGGGAYFLFVQPTEQAPPPELAAPTGDAPYAVQVSISIPPFLRERFSGPLFAIGDISLIGAAGNVVPKALLSASSFKIGPDGTARVDIPFTPDGLSAFENQKVSVNFVVCRVSPNHHRREGCTNASPDEALGFRKDVKLGKIGDHLRLDLGQLKPRSLVAPYFNLYSCGPGDSLTGRIMPTASFLQRYPAGTPVLFLLRSLTFWPKASGLLAGEGPAGVEAFFKKNGLQKVFLHAQLMKLDPGGMPFSVPASGAWVGAALGSMVVCRPGEPAEACAARYFPLPLVPADVDRGIFFLVGKDLLLPDCRQKDFVFHLHDFSGTASPAQLPPEVATF